MIHLIHQTNIFLADQSVPLLGKLKCGQVTNKQKTIVAKGLFFQFDLPAEVIVDFLIIWDLTQDIHLQPGVLQGSTLLKQPTNVSWLDWWSMAEGLAGLSNVRGC
ncbi:hypothetical protein ACJX0J_018854 [Zea mays]